MKKETPGIHGLDHLTCSLFYTRKTLVPWMPFQILPDEQSMFSLSLTFYVTLRTLLITFSMISHIRIRPAMFLTAGTKDKRAITCQLVIFKALEQLSEIFGVTVNNSDF